ncbi:MAG: hypothetical protein JNM00_08205 [Flavobacteriales bacterium]|nr:hypothetical protein [Flavobacteriales bacterium]
MSILIALCFYTGSSSLAGIFFTGDTLSPGDSLLLRRMNDLEAGFKQLSAEPNEKKNDERNKKVHFGLSLGYRWLSRSSQSHFHAASVSPIDSSLRLTTMDGTSYLFSTSLIFDLDLKPEGSRVDEIPKRRTKYRQKKSHQVSLVNPRSRIGRFMFESLNRFCIVSNLNLLDFGNGQKELAFNKSVEGGLGIGYRLNEYMYLGINWEQVYSMQLYDDLKAMEGETITYLGVPVLSSNQLDQANEDLFYRESLYGWSLKVIFCL